MSLSEQNRALIQRDLGQSYWEPNDGYVWLAAATEGDLNRLLNAARAEGVATESKPTEMGGFVGDIFYGDPVHTTRGTHRWTGTEWRRLPSEVETLTELLAEARARVAALQQAGEPISRENLEAELRETIGLYVREAVTRMFSEENATYRCARQIAGMLQPGYYLHRKLFSSPLPQQTDLVEEGVEKIIAPHEPAACGEGTLPSPSEPPRSAGKTFAHNHAHHWAGPSPDDARELQKASDEIAAVRQQVGAQPAPTNSQRSDGEVAVYLAPREGGGLRVWSDEVIGLILSGPDPRKVGADIWPAIEAIRAHKRASRTKGEF